MIEENKELNKKLDEFHYHEAIDRSFIIGNMIEELLVQHPVFQKHEELKANAEAAQELIINSYIEIGRLLNELFPEPSDKPENE